MSIDYETLKKIKSNTYTKLKDGIYDAYLLSVDYSETGNYNIPTVNFTFEVGNKKTIKGLFLTDKKGMLIKFNKQKLDRYIAIITGEYPEYNRRHGLKDIIEHCKFDKIPVKLILMTPIASMYQNFTMEFE